MKKLVMAVAMMAATAAMAGEFATFEIDPGKQNSVGTMSDAGQVVIGKTFDKWTVDGKAVVSHESTGKVTNDFYGRLTYNLTQNLYVRGGVGERVASTGDYSYYVYGGGVTANLIEKTTVGLDYAHQVPFTAGNPTIDVYKATAMYELTPKDSAGLAWNVTTGDTISHGIGLIYRRKFN